MLKILVLVYKAENGFHSFILFLSGETVLKFPNRTDGFHLQKYFLKTLGKHLSLILTITREHFFLVKWSLSVWTRRLLVEEKVNFFFNLVLCEWFFFLCQFCFTSNRYFTLNKAFMGLQVQDWSGSGSTDSFLNFLRLSLVSFRFDFLPAFLFTVAYLYTELIQVSCA